MKLALTVEFANAIHQDLPTFQKKVHIYAYMINYNIQVAERTLINIKVDTLNLY